MTVRNSLIAAAVVATFTAGASAAYLNRDIYGAPSYGASHTTAMKSEEGVPQDLVTA